MEDFYPEVRKALKSHLAKEFKNQYNADPFIALSVSSKPIIISKEAFYKSNSKKRRMSLEYIFNQHLKLKYEIPFAGIIDDSKLLVSDFIIGQPGVLGYCEWTDKLLSEAGKKASEKNMKISLGHTHPKNYGAICSKIFYTRKNLEESDKSLHKHILKEGLHKKYGGDYSDMLSLTKINPSISSFFSILSPEENKIGFFEIKPLGEVIYHPWKISD